MGDTVGNPLCQMSDACVLHFGDRYNSKRDGGHAFSVDGRDRSWPVSLSDPYLIVCLCAETHALNCTNYNSPAKNTLIYMHVVK